MSYFTDIENKPDDWLFIQKPMLKSDCDTALLVLNYLSEFKTESLKLRVKDNLGLFVDTILSKNSNNPISNKIVYEEFNKLKSRVGRTIDWGNDSDMNDCVEEGTYIIKGKKTKQDDNLPIINTDDVSAHLIVIVTENDNNKVITLILNINDSVGGNIYIRSCQNEEWKPWGKLQTNIEVASIIDEIETNLDSEITRAEGAEQSLADKIDAEAQRAKEAEQANKKLISDLVGESPETLDTIHEISSWILNDKTGAAAMAKAITAETQRAEGAEKANADAIADEITRAQGVEQSLDNKIDALNERIDNIPTGGGGTGEIVDGAVTESKLSFDVKNTLNTAYDKATLADSLITNFNKIKPKRGAVNNDGTIYYGTSFCAHIALTGEGKLLLNDGGYFISKIVILYKDGSAADVFEDDLQEDWLDFSEDSLSWLIEFRKSDNTTFNNNDLEKVIKNVSFNPVAWNEYSNLDNYNCTGEYIIRGERKNNGDNMPINNLGDIEARLNVISDTTGKNTTQVLTLLNVGGGDGNIYTRTRQDNTWGAWGKLQTNVEVGVVDGQQIEALDDNGVYSGVLSATGETFVLVVINNYAIATQAGYGGYISQLKYSIDLAGVVKVETRRSDAFGSWTDWQSIGGSKPSELLVPSEWQGKLSTLSDGVHEFYGDCSFGKSGTLWGWADSYRYNVGEPTYIKLIKKGQDTALAQAIGTAASATRMINIQTETLL